MSFKQNRNRLKLIKYKNKEIIPKQGCLTLIHWSKGNKTDGFYIKAELYGLDGELLNIYLHNGNLNSLIDEIKLEYNLDKLNVK